METSEVIFNLVDTMHKPVIVFEKDDSEETKWSEFYTNKLMKNLLKSKPVGIKNEDAPDYKEEFYNLLPSLLEQYEIEQDSQSCLLHEVEIFDSVYNIYISKSEEHLLMFLREIKLKEIFENITLHDFGKKCSAAVVILDSDKNIIDTNECFLEMLGAKKEKAIGKNFFDTYVSGNTEKFHHYFSNILKAEIINNHFITTLKSLRFEKLRVNWQLSKIVRKDKVYIVAVGNDVSKLIKENGILKKELTNMKIGFEYFPFAVGYMNANGVFTNMNPRFKKMFNVPAEEEKMFFDDIALFRKNIGFENMKKHINLIKKMNYNIEFKKADKLKKIKVDINLLSGKKESSKLYILVAQKIK